MVHRDLVAKLFDGDTWIASGVATPDCSAQSRLMPTSRFWLMVKTHLATSIFLVTLATFMSGCSSSISSLATPEILSGDEIEARNSFDTNSRFIIYLHGKIIEDEGVDAEHSEHGRYEYLETLSYLATTGGQIISEVRPSGTNGVEYAGKVTGWITHLLDAGVPPQNISVVGFSKGAGIAIYVSDMLKNPDINLVLIGICGEWINSDPAINLSGRLLSLFETSDEYGGSCQELADRSPGISDFKEISYSTGEGHGTFYQAESFWLDSVIEWITVKE
jgi:hypothetical protein